MITEFFHMLSTIIFHILILYVHCLYDEIIESARSWNMKKIQLPIFDLKSIYFLHLISIRMNKRYSSCLVLYLEKLLMYIITMKIGLNIFWWFNESLCLSRITSNSFIINIIVRLMILKLLTVIDGCRSLISLIIEPFVSSVSVDWTAKELLADASQSDIGK